jgi:hypothetical protein
MVMTRYPKDLAEVVSTVLKKESKIILSKEILTTLFENMYFASIKTEEAAPITFNIVYIDPSNPDPKPPQRIVRDRWSYVNFSTPIGLNLANIIKLAKASDPRTSSLAIYRTEDEDELSIWGLIDQGNDIMIMSIMNLRKGQNDLDYSKRVLKGQATLSLI